MIPIPPPNSKIGTVLMHDDFYFASRSRNNVHVPEFSIIVNQANLDQYVCAIPRIIDLDTIRLPFYLQHTDLFENAQKIFKDLFGVDPDVLLLYAYKNDCTKSAFLFSNRSFIESAGTDPIQFKYEPHDPLILRKIENDIKNENKQERPIKNLNIAESSVFYTLPKGIFPVIGTYNDLTTEDKKPSFNLIFGSYFSNRFYELNKELTNDSYDEKFPDRIQLRNNDWEGQVDSELERKFIKGIPLYCIKSFNLKSVAYYKCFDPGNMSNYYRNVNGFCADDFATTISNLILSINRGTYLPTSLEQFASCMPHFYKVDRTEQSVRITQSLQLKLRNLYGTAKEFGSRIHSLTFKDFVEFFILESIIDFELFFDDPGQELYKALTRKRTITPLLGDNEILSKFLNKATPNDKFSSFVSNQVDAKDNVMPYLY
jgi:hypothetical protein